MTGKARNPEAVEVLDQLSAHISSRKSSAGKTRAPFSTIQDQAVMTNGSTTPPKEGKSPSSSAKSPSKSGAAFPVPSHKPTEEGRLSQQASLAKPVAEESLTRRTSLKRKSKPQSEQSDTGADKRGRALPAVPARMVNERANGIGRAESGELPQDTGAASMSASGEAQSLIMA